MTNERGAGVPIWPRGVVASLEELAGFRSEGERLRLGNSERVGTLLAGAHRSPFRGQGMEFAEVREYHPGDDPRSIDWKVTARTGSVHTKLFHEERERPVLFLVDLGASMQFGTRRCFKSVLAARITALLGFSALGVGDRVGGVVLSDQNIRIFRALRTRRRWMGFLDTVSVGTQLLSPALSPLPASPPSSAPSPPAAEKPVQLDQAMRRLLSLANPGCQVVLLSDFYRPGPEFETSLRLLARRTALHLVHIFDPLERQAPPPGRYRISDGHHLAECNLNSSRLRRDWGQEFLQRERWLKDLCDSYRASFVSASTAVKAVDVLASRPRGAVVS